MAASFDRRADVLKAARALADLLDNARRAGDRDLYDAAERILDQPAMFPLQVIEMAQLLATRSIAPPPSLQKQAQEAISTWLTATSGHRRRPSRTEAMQAVREWRAWQQLTDLAGRRVADVMVRAWQLSTEEAR